MFTIGIQSIWISTRPQKLVHLPRVRMIYGNRKWQNSITASQIWVSPEAQQFQDKVIVGIHQSHSQQCVIIRVEVWVCSSLQNSNHLSYFVALHRIKQITFQFGRAVRVSPPFEIPRRRLGRLLRGGLRGGLRRWHAEVFRTPLRHALFPLGGGHFLPRQVEHPHLSDSHAVGQQVSVGVASKRVGTSEQKKLRNAVNFGSGIMVVFAGRVPRDLQRRFTTGCQSIWISTRPQKLDHVVFSMLYGNRKWQNSITASQIWVSPEAQQFPEKVIVGIHQSSNQQCVLIRVEVWVCSSLQNSNHLSYFVALHRIKQITFQFGRAVRVSPPFEIPRRRLNRAVAPILLLALPAVVAAVNHRAHALAEPRQEVDVIHVDVLLRCAGHGAV